MLNVQCTLKSRCTFPPSQEPSRLKQCWIPIPLYNSRLRHADPVNYFFQIFEKTKIPRSIRNCSGTSDESQRGPVSLWKRNMGSVLLLLKYYEFYKTCPDDPIELIEVNCGQSIFSKVHVGHQMKLDSLYEDIQNQVGTFCEPVGAQCSILVRGRIDLGFFFLERYGYLLSFPCIQQC